MIPEWAPVWTVPVIPLPGRVVPEDYVPHVFPGTLDSRMLVVLRRIRAAILVPRAPVGRETRLPIPAVALNRRDPGKGSRTIHVPTARGFDMYRLCRGRLREVWSRQEPDEASIPLGWSGSIRVLCAPHLTRATRLHRFGPYLGTIGLLAVALALQMRSEGLPHTDPASAGDGRTRSALPDQHTIPLVETTTVLLDLSRSMAGFQLFTMDLDGNGGVIRFRVDLPVEETLLQLAGCLPEEWDRTARWTEAGTEVTVIGRVSHE